MSDIQSLVQHLNLLPHPEGGFYRETYRSEGIIPKQSLPAEFSGDRNYCTGIYFLLTSENFSAFHRIHQDEMWHFYQGSPLHVHVIDAAGDYSCHSVSNRFDLGHQPQLVVPAGCWFASSVAEPDSYSLVGCTVAPGFDFADFELAKKEDLLAQYPEHEEVIARFTRQ